MNTIYATVDEITEIIKANDDGGFLTGGAPLDEAVAEWDGEGLTGEEIAAYIQSRVFRGSTAAELRDAGITPQQAGLIMSGHVDTIGYECANGDLSVQTAKAWLDQQ